MLRIEGGIKLTPKINEYDYLHINARIHAIEGKMLTRDRVERMLEARSAEESAKVLSECGYEDIGALTPLSIERSLGKARLAIFEELRKAAPDPRLVDVFRIKYDYHNAKTLLKAEAMGSEPDALFIDAGRYRTATLRDDYVKEDFRHESETFRKAVVDAKETLAVTLDPQKADFVLDRAYYAEMLEEATATLSEFLLGYVRLSIDASNLRAAVRASRMGQDLGFVKQVLVPGGDIPEDMVAEAALGNGDLAARYSRTPLEGAAALGGSLLSGGSLTEFERLCDNAVTAYLAKARRIAFGEMPIIGYLYAREAELTTIRIILTGKLAGLDNQTIRERLRDTYV